MQDRELEKDLVLVYDTAKEFHEATGLDFYTDIEPVAQRKFLEYYKEDYETTG